jgi:hypothetical protein
LVTLVDPLGQKAILMDMNPETVQQRIQIARRDAEALKDRIKRKKDELADATREFLHPSPLFNVPALPSMLAELELELELPYPLLPSSPPPSARVQGLTTWVPIDFFHMLTCKSCSARCRPSKL